MELFLAIVGAGIVGLIYTAYKQLSNKAKVNDYTEASDKCPYIREEIKVNNKQLFGESRNVPEYEVEEIDNVDTPDFSSMSKQKLYDWAYQNLDMKVDRRRKKSNIIEDIQGKLND